MIKSSEHHLKIVSTIADGMCLSDRNIYNLDYRQLCNAVSHGLVSLKNHGYDIVQKEVK